MLSQIHFLEPLTRSPQRNLGLLPGPVKSSLLLSFTECSLHDRREGVPRSRFCDFPRAIGWATMSQENGTFYQEEKGNSPNVWDTSKSGSFENSDACHVTFAVKAFFHWIRFKIWCLLSSDHSPLGQHDLRRKQYSFLSPGSGLRVHVLCEETRPFWSGQGEKSHFS